MTSKFLIFLIVLFAAAASFKNSGWERNLIIRNDVVDYYGYLPAFFIYHDLKFNFVDAQPEQIKSKIFRTKTADNRYVQKMTMGVALMLSPFFYSAHLFSILNLLPATGYTPVYEFSIALAALFYLTIGLFFLKKTLEAFFDKLTVLLTLPVIALCTNLFNYSTFEPGMSHVYNFCLISVFVWLTVKWHEKPSVLNSLFMGLILGMITLVRPNNCLVIIFFIFYSINDKNSFLQKFKLVKEKWLQLIVVALSVFIPISFQLIYWKFSTGHWVYYSYGNQIFFFNNPHILQGLFGFRKGFFIYTPVMILIFPGLWFALKEKKKFAWSVIIFFIANVYVMFSWWCWWYGGSFGCRPMVDSYAVLALPLGFFIEKCTGDKKLKKIVLIVFIFLCAILNLFQTGQAKSTLLHWDGMNVKLYFKIFGTNRFPENYDLMVTPSDGENAMKGLPERDVFDLSVNGLKLLSSCNVNIKGANNKFVCAENNNNGFITCNREQPYQWETFLMRRYYGNVCTFQSSQEKYVGIGSEADSTLRAYKASPGRTEIFKIMDLDSNRFALKSFNGSFITVQKTTPEILMNGVYNIGRSETFELIVKSDSLKKE